MRHTQIYQTIKEEHERHNYPIGPLCKLGHVSRAAYYKWLHRDIPAYETENELPTRLKRSIWKALTKVTVGFVMIWNDIMISK